MTRVNLYDLVWARPLRHVAVELGVHFNTVAEAYRQLAAEGWLDLKHGRGAVVGGPGQHSSQ